MIISSNSHPQTVTPFSVNQNHAGSKAVGKELTPEEEKIVQELKKRDAEVRRHEQAHKAAAGRYAMGGPHYDYQTGPDGRQYAVGGEVTLDTSEIPGDPKATIAKAAIIKKAALAPNDPSSQDQKVAAEASRMAAKARQELAKQQREEAQIYAGDGQKAQGPVTSAFDLFV